MRRPPPGLLRELWWTAGFFLFSLAVFSALFILGHLIFYNDWPRWM